MSGYGITFNGITLGGAVPSVVVQRIRRPIIGKVRDVYVEVPGRESAWLFNEEPGDATITMECMIVATSRAARRAAVRSVAGWASSRGRCPLIVDDESDRQWWAKLASPPDVEEAINWGKFSLEWRVQPYAEQITTTNVALAGLSVGVTTNFTVVSDGIVRQFPVLEITTTSAAATGVAFELNGIALATTEVLGAGVIRTFSSLTATVTSGANANAELATNTFSGANLAMPGVSGDFAMLANGVNTLKPTRGAFTARIAWRRRLS